MGGLKSSSNWIFIFIGEVTVLILLAVCIDGQTSRDSPTFASNIRSSSWKISTDRPLKQNDEDDSDEDDEDSEDHEHTHTIVIAAAPVVLGVLAIVLLCIFMLCRQGRLRQSKCAIRRHQASLTSTRIESDHDILAQSSYEIHNYIAETPRLPRLQVSTVPSAPPEEDTDLPPSYEEVMQSESRLKKLTNPAP